MTEAEKDLATIRRTKCRVWLKTKLAHYIHLAQSQEKQLHSARQHAKVEQEETPPVAGCDYD